MSVGLLAALFCIACYGVGFVVGRWYGRQRIGRTPIIVYSNAFAEDSARARQLAAQRMLERAEIVTYQDSTGDE